MRILLTSHFPFDDPVAGPVVGELALALGRLGHRARCLVVDRRRQGAAPVAVERIVCSTVEPDADVAMDLPEFSDAACAFTTLSDAQLADYRAALRRALDDQIAGFDPHVVHAQHVWLFGHLALESGVPYLLTAYGPELAAVSSDPRYRRLAQEAVENAGCVFVPDAETHRRMIAVFGDLDGHIEPLPGVPGRPLDDEAAAAVAATYLRVYRQRFGENCV